MRAWLLLVVASACGRIRFDPAGVRDAMRNAADVAAAGDAGVDAAPGTLYAASSAALYAIDPATLAPSLVVGLCPNRTAVGVSDIAFDHTGALFAVDQNAALLYRVDAATGACTAVSVPAILYALEAVPPGIVSSGPALVGVTTADDVVIVDPTTGAETTIGPLGVGIGGDLAWTGTTLLATDNATPANLLRVDPATGAGTALGSTTLSNVFGLAWRGGHLYAFANGGEIAELDPASGAVLRSIATSFAWAGGGTSP